MKVDELYRLILELRSVLVTEDFLEATLERLERNPVVEAQTAYTIQEGIRQQLETFVHGFDQYKI